MLEKAIILSKNSTPIEDTNDTSSDEQFYTAHPIASGTPTMRYAGFFKTRLAHETGLTPETGALVLSKNATPIEDTNDTSSDEQFYTAHPIASGTPTMRLR